MKVYLPRLFHNVEEQMPLHQASSDPSQRHRGFILVVEDEPAMREFSLEALRLLGYRVFEADGAAAALAVLDVHPEITLLFTDVIMPEVNGRKLADEACIRRPDLKVLFTTGYTRKQWSTTACSIPKST